MKGLFLPSASPDGDHYIGSEPWRRVRPYVLAAAIVFCGLLIAQALLVGLQVSRVSVVLLAAVVVAAIAYGRRPAIFAAAAAFLAQNIFLLQPLMKAQMGTREQVLTLGIFFLVALLTGNLAGRMRDAAARAIKLSDMNSTLFDASGRMSTTDDEAELRGILMDHVEKLTGKPAALVSPVVAESRLRNDALIQSQRLAAQNETVDVLLWRRRETEFQAVDETVRVLADLCAASIARARLAAQKRELEIAAQSERLQTALLSSISHDFRTPLAAILTSASSLVEFGERFSPETRADLAVTIQEEAERLNRYVANLLNMTKLDAGALRVNRVRFDVREVIDRVVRLAQRNHASKTIATDIALESEAIGEPVLFESALQNVVENAFRFARSTVKIRQTREDGNVVTSICDDGPGVAPGDLARIFERFYHAGTPPLGGANGAGLGLSIARGFMEAMKGSVDARLGCDGVGLDIRLSLPSDDRA